ncbi:hypothetical protein [Streptococcus taonis]|uniref:Phage protein n=1 Tax=Streptococcus taonis TaxID=3041623 RepID=A0ABT6PC01_9STRE|nr:hypothetical protein [Streptococcus sp. ST22-14]MDI1473145.1 hypothetical protein [Streptococcus sp. ST22-14]
MVNTSELKQMLRELRANRLTNYSEIAYQWISHDWHFENVPIKLRKHWYSQDNLSFITLSINYDSDIDSMSHNDLEIWIDNERRLISRLENIFSSIENK